MDPTAEKPTDEIRANYDVEGSDLGYRWYARERKKTLFPFGYGLSYTIFDQSDFKTDGKTATFTLKNTGDRAGANVGQVYLVSVAGEKKQRLVGFKKVNLAPNEQRTVQVEFDPRLLAEWENGSWVIKGGDYRFALGRDAETLGEPVTVRLAAKRWKD